MVEREPASPRPRSTLCLARRAWSAKPSAPEPSRSSGTCPATTDSSGPAGTTALAVAADRYGDAVGIEGAMDPRDAVTVDGRAEPSGLEAEDPLRVRRPAGGCLQGARREVPVPSRRPCRRAESWSARVRAWRLCGSASTRTSSQSRMYSPSSASDAPPAVTALPSSRPSGKVGEGEEGGVGLAPSPGHQPTRSAARWPRKEDQLNQVEWKNNDSPNSATAAADRSGLVAGRLGATLTPPSSPSPTLPPKASRRQRCHRRRRIGMPNWVSTSSTGTTFVSEADPHSAAPTSGRPRFGTPARSAAGTRTSRPVPQGIPRRSSDSEGIFRLRLLGSVRPSTVIACRRSIAPRSRRRPRSGRRLQPRRGGPGRDRAVVRRRAGPRGP